jgi:hypothetical protein
MTRAVQKMQIKSAKNAYKNAEKRPKNANKICKKCK